MRRVDNGGFFKLPFFYIPMYNRNLCIHYKNTQKGQGLKHPFDLKCARACLQHICTQCFQCFLSNMLDIGNILKTTSIRFQKEKLTTGECKDELMVAIGQFIREGHMANTVSNVDADRDKTNLLRGLIEELEIRYNSLKSCDHFLVFDPSTWPQKI